MSEIVCLGILVVIGLVWWIWGWLSRMERQVSEALERYDEARAALEETGFEDERERKKD